jgi:hypothetical protein
VQGFQLQTAAFRTAHPAKPGRRSEMRPDIFFAGAELAETVRVTVDVVASKVTVEVEAADDEDWRPVAREDLRQGLEAMLVRESRLEQAAARFGVTPEALLVALESSVVDVANSAGLIPEAEAEALREAGISLEGAQDDPAGAGQVAAGVARFHRFRDEALTVSEAAGRLGVSAGRVRQLITAKSVISIPNDDGGHLLPAWQFVGNRVVPALDRLADVVVAVHPLTFAGFMTRPDVDLVVDGEPVSPVQWLISGGDPAVVRDLAAVLSIPA